MSSSETPQGRMAESQLSLCWARSAVVVTSCRYFTSKRGCFRFVKSFDCHLGHHKSSALLASLPAGSSQGS